MENLHDKREIYKKGQLLESEIEKDPILQFKRWYDTAAENKEVGEANAMSVSTVEHDGCPRTRMVLLKEFSEQGFIFFTNYESRKGKALAEHPLACLQFFWPKMEQQVIIKAKLMKISKEASDQYFSERPKGSQLGAMASAQSSVIPNRSYLESRLLQLEKEFEGKIVGRPAYWGGYLAIPYEMEFWQGRPNRLHDRILYYLDAGVWKICRLAP